MDSQPQEALPGTLIIGSNIRDTLLLAKGIFYRTNAKDNQFLYESLSKMALSLKVGDSHVSEKYKLDTSYYHCESKLICATYEHIVPFLDSDNPDAFLEKQNISSIESVIFVSNLKGNNKAGVEQYLNNHKEIIEKYNPELTICFAHTDTIRGEELFGVFHFGEGDVFVEVIDDNLDDVEVKKEDPAAKQPKFEEKEGIDRVVENLECHMWSNMVQKDPKKKAAIDVLNGDAPTEEETVEVKKEEVKQLDTKEEKPNVQKEKVAEENKVSKELEQANGTKVHGDKMQNIMNALGGEEEEDEDEKGIDDLAKVLETVRQFKMDSKGLPDEQRKQQATNLLMKLIANCPDLQMGDESDDEEIEA